MRTAVLGSLLAILALLGACEPATRNLTVDVQTDLVAQYELGVLDVDLFVGAVASGTTGEVSRSVLVEPRIGEAESYRRGRRVAEITGLAQGTYTVRVIGRRPAAPGAPVDGGAFLVERRIVFTLDGDRIVRVVLNAPCVDAECPRSGDAATQTQCFNGECVDPACDPSRPETSPSCCVGSGCIDTALCDDDDDCDVPACALPSCIEGACIAGERPGACDSGEYCDRSAGTCLPIPGGEPDAGPRDAGHTEDTRCPAEVCGNGVDDDCDARADCADDDCTGTACDDGDPCTHADACTGAAMGVACAGTAITCTSDECMTRACNGTAACSESPHGGACSDDGNVCTSDVCSGGVCTHPPVAGTVFCADDGNPCSFDLCEGGACVHPRGFDGWACGIFGRCCNNACVDVSSDPSNCGVCGIRCPRGCLSGACESGSNAECIAAGYGSLATAYMSRCQCRCTGNEADRLTCTGQCAGGGTCDQRDGLNPCYYP
jgi:hypothetical protein